MLLWLRFSFIVLRRRTNSLDRAAPATLFGLYSCAITIHFVAPPATATYLELKLSNGNVISMDVNRYVRIMIGNPSINDAWALKAIGSHADVEVKIFREICCSNWNQNQITDALLLCILRTLWITSSWNFWGWLEWNSTWALGTIKADNVNWKFETISARHHTRTPPANRWCEKMCALL